MLALLKCIVVFHNPLVNFTSKNEHNEATVLFLNGICHADILQSKTCFTEAGLLGVSRRRLDITFLRALILVYLVGTENHTLLKLLLAHCFQTLNVWVTLLI